MRGIRAELFDLPEGAVQSRDHLIECLDEPGYLVFHFERFDSLVQVLRGDHSSRLSDIIHGLQGFVRQKLSPEACDDKDQRAGDQ